jgi:dolichol-phosphate mannosyltransferase
MPFAANEPPPEITVVVPCYNELDNLVPLIDELRGVLDPLGRTYEILYVDDCSKDGTTDRLISLCKEYACLRVVRHKSNFGESAGELTGFECARGSIIITIDADLQNDPADIPEMLRRLESADAICGVRRKREDSLSKKISSRVANKVRHWLLNDDIHDAGCTYRALRRDALNELPRFRALHRFLPSILKWHGYRVEEMLVNHRPRTKGLSKYGVGNRLWVGIYDIFGMRWYRKRFLPPNRRDTKFGAGN